MSRDELSIGELADAAGLSRRAIRFYVQQRLLPPPTGLGRGRHYRREHVERLRQIQALQSAGHSLDAIRRIVEGREASAAAAAPIEAREPERAVRLRPTLSAELWTRLSIAEGVEIHFDAGRHHPEIEGLLALRALARQVFKIDRTNGDIEQPAPEAPSGPGDAHEQ